MIYIIQMYIQTYYIPKVTKIYGKNGNLRYQVWKCHIWHLHMYFQDQNKIQSGGTPWNLNFEGLEMQKWNIQAVRTQKAKVRVWEKYKCAPERFYGWCIYAAQSFIILDFYWSWSNRQVVSQKCTSNSTLHIHYFSYFLGCDLHPFLFT